MNGGGRALICTDLDRTLLPNGTQPESAGARRAFRHLVEQPGVVLVYVSGRDRGRIEAAIGCYALPVPAVVAADVGTSVYDLRSGAWASSDEWQRMIGADWNGLTQPDVASLLASFGELRLQERSKQNRFKLSYYVPSSPRRSRLAAEIGKRLASHGVAASLVWSIDEPAGVGLLDVVPERATKLHAVEFIRERLGFGVEETVFAGDSGNDLEVLASPVPSVLVANATAEVKREAQALARQLGHESMLYIASGAALGMNGNYSAGIMEGVLHYRPDLAALLETPDGGEAAGANEAPTADLATSPSPPGEGPGMGCGARIPRTKPLR